MRLLSTWLDYLNTGRVRLDLGQGIELDTAEFAPAVPPDTGWRKMTPHADVDAGTVLLRRIGPTVYLALSGVSTAVSGHRNVVSIPSGFQPDPATGFNWRDGVVVDDAGTAPRVASYYGGNMRILNASASSAYGGALSWPTSQAFPTVYPGTPG